MKAQEIRDNKHLWLQKITQTMKFFNAGNHSVRIKIYKCTAKCNASDQPWTFGSGDTPTLNIPTVPQPWSVFSAARSSTFPENDYTDMWGTGARTSQTRTGGLATGESNCNPAATLGSQRSILTINEGRKRGGVLITDRLHTPCPIAVSDALFIRYNNGAASDSYMPEDNNPWEYNWTYNANVIQDHGAGWPAAHSEEVDTTPLTKLFPKLRSHVNVKKICDRVVRSHRTMAIKHRFALGKFSKELQPHDLVETEEHNIRKDQSFFYFYHIYTVGATPLGVTAKTGQPMMAGFNLSETTTDAPAVEQTSILGVTGSTDDVYDFGSRALIHMRQWRYNYLPYVSGETVTRCSWRLQGDSVPTFTMFPHTMRSVEPGTTTTSTINLFNDLPVFVGDGNVATVEGDLNTGGNKVRFTARKQLPSVPNYNNHIRGLNYVMAAPPTGALGTTNALIYKMDTG